MSIESTQTVRRSSAIRNIKRLLEENKNSIVPKNNNVKELTSALNKLGITENNNSPIGYLTETEFNALINNIENLSNEQLEELLYKFRPSIFDNYEVGEDEWDCDFDW